MGDAIVTMVMDSHRRGAMRRAVLYDVNHLGGLGGNMKDYVADADGKVRLVLTATVSRR